MRFNYIIFTKLSKDFFYRCDKISIKFNSCEYEGNFKMVMPRSFHSSILSRMNNITKIEDCSTTITVGLFNFRKYCINASNNYIRINIILLHPQQFYSARFYEQFWQTLSGNLQSFKHNCCFWMAFTSSTTRINS